MTDLTQLYQDTILTFARRARDAERLENPDAQAAVVNPSCGDEVEIDINISDGVITELGAQAKGCAICEAATGYALDALIDLPVEDLSDLPHAIGDFLNQSRAEMPLAGGEAFAVFQHFKSRHSCALLVFEAAAKATRR